VTHANIHTMCWQLTTDAEIRSSNFGCLENQREVQKFVQCEPRIWYLKTRFESIPNYIVWQYERLFCRKIVVSPKVMS